MRLSSALLRWQGLALLALVSLKVFFADLAFLRGFYRIISSIALGVVLIAISYLYQRRLMRGAADGGPQPAYENVPHIALAAAGAAVLAAQGAAGTGITGGMRRRSRWRTAPATRLVAVELTDAVSRRASPGWSDLRVVDDAGREVPYVLHARTGGTTIEWRPARLLEPGFVSGRYTEATVDLGPAAGIHNLLRLQVDGQDDLQARVEVATSADGAEWKVIREGAPISRLAGVGPERLDVTYPDSRSSLDPPAHPGHCAPGATCWRARGARDRHRSGAASGDRRAGRGCASRNRQRLDDCGRVRVADFRSAVPDGAGVIRAPGHVSRRAPMAARGCRPAPARFPARKVAARRTIAWRSVCASRPASAGG